MATDDAFAPPSSRCVTAEVAAAYASGELSADQLASLDEHIDGCASCRTLLSNAAELAALSSKTVSSAPTIPRTGGSSLGLIAAGTVVGRYVIAEPLGSGGMGVVYAAHDPKLDRRVALKAIRQDIIASGHSAEELLGREAVAMARLAHPNVVGVHDLFATDGTIFVAMDLVEGTTLRRWLRERPRSIREIVDTFVRAGRGLAAAHDQGIVHRDFKADNVLCGRGGRVCVSDFGLSRITEARDGPPSSAQLGGGPRATGVAGTPGYMAPEQLAGQGASALSDQYSFCVSLHEALYGALPPSRDSARDHEALESRRVRPGVPTRVRRVLARGLRTDPRQRYPSMNALLDELARDPTARSAIWLGLGGAVAAVALAWSLARSHAAAAKVCRGSEARLVGAWDDTRRADVERAFLGTGKPFAADAWRSVRDSLDRYASDWVAARTDACEATRVREEQSEGLLDLRVECMDRRLAEVRGLVDTFARANGDVVESSVQAAHGLTPLAECSATRVAHEGLGAAHRDDPAIVATLARASASRLAGKYREAEQAAQAAIDAARAAGKVDQEARATYELGLAVQSEMRLADAEGILFGALTLAQREGADGLAAKVAVKLADALGEERKSEEAERWLRVAAATGDRLGGDAELDAMVANTRAKNLYTEGRYQDSIDEQERGLRIEEKLPPDTLRSAVTANTLAGSLRDVGDLERAQEMELRALGLYEQALGAAHPRTGKAFFNLGAIAMDRGRYEEARAYYERALATAVGLGGVQVLVAVRSSSLGHALALLGRYDEATRYLDRARAVAESIPSFPRDRLARIDIHMGQLARLERRYDEAERSYRRALAVAPEGPREIPDALTGLGRVLLDRGDGRRAVEPLERSAAILGQNAPLADRAETGLALAEALWLAGDRKRTPGLVAEARLLYDRDPSREGEAHDLEEWLATRGLAARPRSAQHAVPPTSVDAEAPGLAAGGPPEGDSMPR